METKQKYQDSGYASWNINSHHAQLVFNMLSRSQNFYLKGDMGNYFTSLRGIYELIIYNLELEVINSMDKKVEAVSCKQRYWNKYKSIVDEGLNCNLTNEEVKGKSEFVDRIRLFQRSLLKLLKHCGYLTNKSDTSYIEL